MRGEVHILVHCPIDTSLKEKIAARVCEWEWVWGILFWSVSLNKATKLQRAGQWREPSHVTECILIAGIKWYFHKLRMLSTICSQIENGFILILAGGVWGSNQHWECLQSDAPHPGWYHRFYRIENDSEWTKWNLLSKTYFKLCMLPRMDIFCILKLFYRRQPTWPGWTFLHF